MAFRDLHLESFYEGWGDEISAAAISPILAESVTYDRLSSYFSIGSLLSIANGIEKVWRREGHVRLIVGLHDLHAEVLEAHRQSTSSDFEETYKELRNRLFRNLSRLEDEIQLDRVKAFGTMLRDGFIEMKIAGHPGGASEAIFHNKRFIFKDEAGDLITGSSGMNETWMGLARNFDELTLQRSWLDAGDQLEKHVQSFERLWSAKRPDLVVRDIDADFAEEILMTMPSSRRSLRREPSDSLVQIRDLISGSGEYFFHSLEQVTLFPHQERVLKEALRELPVRRILADEVGLGKTLEAGATLKFLGSHLAQERQLIVCPQGLMRQWREEMKAHFGETFWIWDSSKGEYESPDSLRVSMPGKNPFAPEAPTKVIISSQLLRTSRYREILDAGVDVEFDVFLLDEAHAARMTRDSSGRVRKTKMWDIANTLAGKATHCLLLTATPLQMDIVELYGQLSILGLHEEWDDPGVFVDSISAFTDLNSLAPLELCNLVGRLLANSPIHNLQRELESSESAELFSQLRAEDDAFERAFLVQQNADLSRDLLLKLHPAHRMVIRNTRASLISLGYRFPKREFFAPPVETPEKLSAFFTKLNFYLSETYGKVEIALHPSGKFNTGFAVSTYYQRVASSLTAAHHSLQNRRASIATLRQALEMKADSDSIDIANLDGDHLSELEDIDDFEPPQIVEGLKKNKVRGALVAIEREEFALAELLQSLENVSATPWILDPKYQRAYEIIRANESKHPTLVFSRFTDTLEGFLRFFESSTGSYWDSGLGLYTGSEVWLDFDGTRMPASKGQVVRALFEGKVSVLLCSDAASEGLNLQAAGTIINLDVPWNPARLEQRIGRIDRLGQDKQSISIHNLWYPNSVEAEIYKRLLARKENLELAVGRYPQLVADSIRGAVTERLGRGIKTNEEFELEAFRDLAQEKALQALMVFGGNNTKSRDIRNRLFDAFSENLAHMKLEELSLEEGSQNSFRLLHPALDDWWNSLQSSNRIAPIKALTSGGRLVRFVLEESGSLHLLRHEGIVDVIESLLGKIVGGEDKQVERTFANAEELFDWVSKPGNLDPEFGSLEFSDFALQGLSKK